MVGAGAVLEPTGGCGDNHPGIATQSLAPGEEVGNDRVARGAAAAHAAARPWPRRNSALAICTKRCSATSWTDPVSPPASTR
ncbi:MAG: hypothetical protein Kilf2KO_44700 [Rhodospirillales bacterium]